MGDGGWGKGKNAAQSAQLAGLHDASTFPPFIILGVNHRNEKIICSGTTGLRVVADDRNVVVAEGNW